MGEDPTMAERKLREVARRTDSRPGLIAAAQFVRRILPGDDQYGDVLSTAGEGLPGQLGRVVAEVRSEQPSAARELGLGALQAWQALAESQRRGRGTAEVTILFTDLVRFSSWALEAGDEAVLELLRRVCVVEDRAVADQRGLVVKRLGDGAMAVFDEAEHGVLAALDLRRRLAEIAVNGYTPHLRAGVHLGRPRKIGRDYLGVDVNIAARVADAAGPGEVLVSDSVCDRLDPTILALGQRRPLNAPGAPMQLTVCAVEAAVPNA